MKKQNNNFRKKAWCMTVLDKKWGRATIARRFLSFFFGGGLVVVPVQEFVDDGWGIGVGGSMADVDGGKVRGFLKGITKKMVVLGDRDG